MGDVSLNVERSFKGATSSLSTSLNCARDTHPRIHTENLEKTLLSIPLHAPFLLYGFKDKF